MIDTNVFYSDKDLGKKLYRKKTYYTLVIEQEVLADDQDQADRLLSECGIDHSAVTDGLAETKDGVETVIVDANYHDSGKTEYVGKVVYTDDDYAKENGDVEIDTYAPETEEVA
jgi:metal-dependent HD superfamily phosphatase/phosphodiesterase